MKTIWDWIRARKVILSLMLVVVGIAVFLQPQLPNVTTILFWILGVVVALTIIAAATFYYFKTNNNPPSKTLKKSRLGSITNRFLGWLKRCTQFSSRLVLPAIVLAGAVVYTWRHDWAVTAWEWAKAHQVFCWTVLAVIVLGLALRKGANLKSVATSVWALALPVLAFGAIFFGVSSCKEHWLRQDEIAMEVATRAKAPEPATPVRTGSWTEIVPPGEYSKWEISYSGYRTTGVLSAPARYLKGKVVGKEVVVYDMPLKWERPGIDQVFIAYGEGIRYYNDSPRNLVIQWSRSFK